MPRLVESSLCHPHLDALALRRHVELLLDQEELRSRLAQRSLVAFVGDGAVLPRRSGDSDLPMVEGATPFSSPETFRVNFELSSGRTVTGMGIPEGVTVIVGGGYHGKSTLLRALERGVYPHIAGDGREWVITRPDAVTIRAEDGRAVTGVDISPFIDDLPSGTDTTRFTTGNASGSTSQAANLVEAIEAGTSLLLIDEDTSATNFMIRDEPMRRLIPAEREPITPFVDRIRPLYTELGVSTILVAGGSGSFFGVADRVIALDAYVPRDLFPEVPNRVPTGSALRTRGRTTPAKARGRNVIRYGAHTIELNAVAQLVDPAQTTAIARFLDRLAELFDGRRGIRDAVEQLYRRIDEDGLDVLSPYSGHPGHLALPRPHEVHAALNRYRGLALTSRK